MKRPAIVGSAETVGLGAGPLCGDRRPGAAELLSVGPRSSTTTAARRRHPHQGEKIAEIGRNLTAGAGAREIDAAGLVVVPGAVDPHVHPTGSVENLTTPWPRAGRGS